MRLGFLTYPWDLLDEGPERSVAAMASELHCDVLALAACYHHARLYRPRARGRKVLELPWAVAAWQPRVACYPSSTLVPEPLGNLVAQRVLARARESAAQAGIEFSLWAVGLHNSTLGGRNPALCMQNCFGDVYAYNLCPSQPLVQEALRGLIVDLCEQFRPDRIIQEALGFLSLQHGVHHELFFVPWCDSLELLFSLCFCPACRRRVEAAGVDAAGLKQQVASLVDRLLEDESPRLSDGPLAEPAALLAELPLLNAFLALRAETVTGLAAALRAVVAGFGVELDVIPASFHRPLSRAWLEGAAVGDLARAGDRLWVPAYSEQVDGVRADLQWARQAAPDARLAAGLNACSPGLADASVLAAQAGACRDLNCEAVFYYNYGLLTHRRLQWVARANRELRA